jgi:plasmid maintenance system antidote protein VapI
MWTMGISAQAESEISGDELRARIKRLGMTYAAAAERLGLTLAGLNKQMRGERSVSRQTAIILDCLEHHQKRPG